MTIRGALFDLDGVLIDTEPLYTEFWRKTGIEYGADSPTFAFDIKGTTLTDILNRHFDSEVHAEIIDKVDRFENELVYPVFYGVKQFLENLKSRGWKMAIVTSSDDTKMKYLFGQQPDFSDYFDVIVTGSMVTNSKPDPEGYLTAARLLGCRPGDCVVFEDSYQGLEAGRRSGAKVVGLATTNPHEKVACLADIVIDSFDELNIDDL